MEKCVVVLVALYRYQNISVRTLHTLLKSIDGVDVHTVFFKNCETNRSNLPTKKEERLFAKLIDELNPKLIGFNVLSPYVPIARRLTRVVRENSSSLVIWGGVHPTISPESCIDDVDMLCIGEGEGALTDIIRCLKTNEPYQSIKNLWVRKNDHIVKNPMRPLLQDLDLIPFPSYGSDSYYFIDSNSMVREDPTLSEDYFWIQASRGCPYLCSYCVNSLLQPLFKDLGPYTRRRSVNSVIKEIKRQISLRKGITNRVFFIDEVFGTDESWLNDFELRYKNEISIPFFAQYNPKLINTSMLNKLVNAGLDTINFGIQTGSDHIRNRIFHRPGTNKEIISLANKITAFGVRIVYDLIVDNPYETDQTLKSTLEFLLQLPKPLSFNLFSLQYFPNNPLTKRAINDGHIRLEESVSDSLFTRTTRNWAYTPRLLPYTRKQILQNLIWLIVWSHTRDNIVKYSVFGDSLCSRLCLACLNFKSIILGKLVGIGGIYSRAQFGCIAYCINGAKYLLKGDFRTLYLKIQKRMSSMYG